MDDKRTDVEYVYQYTVFSIKTCKGWDFYFATVRHCAVSFYISAFILFIGNLLKRDVKSQ